MPEVVVLGAPVPATARVATALADSLRTSVSLAGENPSAAVQASWPPAVIDPAGVTVFIDDLPRDLLPLRAEILAGLARARAEGRAVRVFSTTKLALGWTHAVADSGLPAATPLRRLYLASGESEASGAFASNLATLLALPLVEPEAAHPGHEYEGWGPRYEALALRETWLIHSPTWHAAEALAPAADLIILLEPSAADPREEFPSPRPEAKKWRRVFAPWLNRYPGVEARLLGREIDHHAGETPVLRIRTPEEQAAVVAALESAVGARPA